MDDAIAEVIVKLVSNPKFAAMMQEKINMKVDKSFPHSMRIVPFGNVK